MKIKIHGITGRMGTLIVKQLQNDSRYHGVIIEALDTKKATIDDQSSLTDTFICDAIIDFSSPTGLKSLNSNLLAYIESQKANPLQAQKFPVVLSGTTGLDNETYTSLNKISEYTPVLHAPNTSVGANLLMFLAKQCAHFLYDKNLSVDICDIHHVHKKDSPSGTALAIKAAIEAQLHADDKPSQAIAIDSVRVGHVVGEHKIKFDTPYESLEIIHDTHDRTVFAQGAVDMLWWLLTRKETKLYRAHDYFF